jgi:hypothetical protein
MNSLFLYVGSIALVVWGIGHLMPTKSIVLDFGPLSDDNRRIITMEWIMEGLGLIFIGVLVFLVALIGGYRDPMAVLVIRACSVMLIVMSALSFATGGKTAIVPMKICPYVKAVVAILFNLGVSNLG